MPGKIVEAVQPMFNHYADTFTLDVAIEAAEIPFDAPTVLALVKGYLAS